MAQPKILIYGENQKESLATSYKTAFEAHGYLIDFYDSYTLHGQLAHWLQNRWLHRLTINSFKIRQQGSINANRHFFEYTTQSKPDFVFIIKGDFIMPETVAGLEKRGIPVYIFHPDNPYPPFPSTRPETLLSAHKAQAYFIWSKKIQKRLQQDGVRNVHYLPFAWDSQVMPYENTYGQHEATPYDIVFVGGWSPSREKWLKPIAEQFRLGIWGPDYWQTRARTTTVKQCWQKTALNTLEFTVVSRQAPISLNILRSQNLPDGTNMRTFELPGCGAFSLSLYTDGAAEIFPPHQAAAYFRTEQELIHQIRHWLQTSIAVRRDMVAHAHQIAHENQYIHRVQQIISVFEGL